MQWLFLIEGPCWKRCKWQFKWNRINNYVWSKEFRKNSEFQLRFEPRTFCSTGENSIFFKYLFVCMSVTPLFFGTGWLCQKLGVHEPKVWTKWSANKRFLFLVSWSWTKTSVTHRSHTSVILVLESVLRLSIVDVLGDVCLCHVCQWYGWSHECYPSFKTWWQPCYVKVKKSCFSRLNHSLTAFLHGVLLHEIRFHVLLQIVVWLWQSGVFY